MTSSRTLWIGGGVMAGTLFAVVLGIVLLGAEIKAAQCASGTGGPPIAPSGEALSDIPGNYLQLYQQAAARYELGGDGWSWLAAVGSIETDHGRLKAPGVTSGENSAGAGGPMQFISGTWAAYGVDGNDDGATDRYDPRDAIPGAAKYLKASGAPGDWRRALFAYNHAGWYVEDVAQRATAYRGAAQAGSVPVRGDIRDDDSSGSSTAPASLPTRPPGPIIQTAADHQARPLGSWQRDNAVDIGVPRGSDVLAVDDGEVLRVSGSPPREHDDGAGGYSITLRTGSNTYFYAHMLRVRVDAGDRVRAGELIGASGFANGVDQLHIGQEHGDPSDVWGNGGAGGQTAPLGGCEGGAPAGPANLGRAVAVRAPRAFAALPPWAMAGARAPAEVDARILPDLLWMLRTYDLRVTAGRETGHASHGDGTAVDLVPANPIGAQNAWDQSALRLSRDIGWTPSCAAAGVAPICPLKPWVRFVGYNGYANHGDPAHVGANAHLHISWLASGAPSGALAPPNTWVRVFPVPAGAGAAGT